MRNPYIDIITQYQKEHLKHFSELGFKIASEFFEKTIIWIIGLSTGTIVLIFTQLNKASDKSFLFNQSALKLTSIFLVSSIALGIVGRILYAIAFYRGLSFISQFYLRVNELALPNSPRQLNGNETSEFIYLLFQEEFNVDLPIILQNKKAASDLSKHLEDQAARELYNDYLNLISTKVKDGKQLVTDLRTKIYRLKISSHKRKKGIIRKVYEKIMPSKGKVWRTFTWVSFQFYILSALLFLLSIIYFITNLYQR
ncbi:MAG: hypothetical protein V4722_06315 [Bacteroidota bacterium]